jgi:hypothetical protein
VGARGLVGSLVAACAALLVLALAPSASAFVYWANAHGNTIGRAALDGSGVVPNFIPAGDQPCGVAVDDRFVYWANSGGSTIGRAALDGSRVDPAFITGLSQPCGPSIDASTGRIYWANQGTGTIGRASIKGTQVNLSFIPASETDTPSSTAIFGGDVYWTNYSGGSVSRASALDGSDAEVFIPEHDAFEPLGIAFFPGTMSLSPAIYWANVGWRTIGAADIVDGSPSGIDTTFIDDLGPTGSTCGLASDGSTYLYWGSDDSVGRAELDGEDVDPQFIQGANGACGVAVDADTASASLTPGNFNFGGVLVGDPAVTEDFTLSNSSGTTVDLTPGTPGLLGPNADQYSITGNDCPSTLAPGASCTITVSFDPNSLGGKAATLTVPGNDPSGPTRAALFGTGTAVDQTIFPASVDFGPQLEGTTSSQHTVTLTNGPGASAADDVGQATLMGADASQFEIVGDNCSNATLPIDASCQIAVRFAPDATGDAAASLSVPSDDASGPATVALSGTGTVPDQDVSPAALAFGSQSVGGRSATQKITVANSADGTGPLQIAGVSIVGGAASQFDLVFDGCSAQSVSPGDNCVLGVRFVPSAPGSQSASVEIASNGATTPVSVSLAGTGIAVPSTTPVTPAPTPNCKALRAKLKKAKSKKKRKAIRKKLRKRGC